MSATAFLVETVSQPSRVAHAAQVNSYSTFASVSYDAGSCGADDTAGVVERPGIKKILKVSNTEIYVAGCFTNFAGVAAADYVAKWDGTAWSGLGASGDISAIVHDMVMYKGELHIVGEFNDAGGDVTADMIAKWSSGAWVGLPVADGVNANFGRGSPRDLAGDYAAALKVKENNAGTSDDILLVGGKFSNGINNGTSGVQFPYTRNIATWNSTTWGSIDTDSQPFINSAEAEYVVHDIEVVGTSIYVSGYRNSATCSSSSTNRRNAFHKFDGTTWTKPITVIDCPVGFGTGFGFYTMEAVGTDIYVGGTFTSLSYVASHLGVYSTTTGTFSAFNSFSAQHGNGAVVRSITSVGSQIFVAGSFPGAQGTSGGVARSTTGSSWQGIGRDAPFVVNAIVGDALYNGTDSRLLIGSAGVNIGGIAAADGFAVINVSSVSTVDAVSTDVGTLTPSFDPAVTSYSLTIPNASASVTFTVMASASGAAIKRTNSTGTIAMSSDTDVLSVAEGATENISFATNSVSGSSTTTYAVAVTRSAAAPTSTSSTTVAPTSTSSTTVAPTSTSSTTVAPTSTSSTTVAPTTVAPTTTTVTVPQPLVSATKSATAASIAKYAMVTVPAGAKVTVKVLSSSSKYCKLVGSSVKGVKNGLCKVTLTVKPKKGSVVTKTVVLKVS
ncbi:unannotated protein [freshwater metagenome]|uniref:Unannotated protein n=1 Tax=freshwater metagenome TaxID=449393 RepID=A0A6J7LGA7_9ZZZZ